MCWNRLFDSCCYSYNHCYLYFVRLVTPKGGKAVTFETVGAIDFTYQT